MTVIRSVIRSVIFSPIRQPTTLYKGGGGFDIYVDSVSGDDSNAGTRATEPLQTLSAAVTAATAHGDGARIGLKYGSHWREELDLDALERCYVAAYGDKADGLPIIDGSDIITGTWDDSTDRADAYTHTYSKSWAHSISAGSQAGGPVVTQDGEILTWQGSIADVDANPGSFYHDGATSDATPVTLYVHTRGGTLKATAVGSSADRLDNNTGTVVGGQTYTIRLYGITDASTDMQLRIKSSGGGSDWTPALISSGGAPTTTYSWTPATSGNIQLRWFSGASSAGYLSITRVSITDSGGNERVTNGDMLGGATTGWTLSANSTIASGTDPTVDNTAVYEATKRDWCVRHRTGTGFMAKHLHVKNPGQSLGGLVFGENGLVEGILSSACMIHDILGASGTMRKCVSWHPHFTNGFGSIVQEFYAETATGLTGTWDQCIVRGPTNIPGEGCDAFGGHSSDSSKYAKWTILDCSVENAGVGLPADLTEFEVARLSVKNGAFLITSNGSTVDSSITDMQIIYTQSAWTSRNYGIAQGGATQNVTIDGLRAVIPASLNTYLISPLNADITNSIMVLTGTGSGSAIKMNSDVNVENVSISGVIIDGNANMLIDAAGILTPGGGSYASDNNVLHGWGTYRVDQPAAAPNVTYTSLALLQAGESYEANSIDVDPDITDPVNGDWTVGGSVGSAGLTRPDITYLPIPASLAAAEAWILANS